MGIIYTSEKWLKEQLFGCKTCGQCILSHTKLICPMTCPKGLRNGPCGGTLNGKCEVIPEMDCVWTRIEDKKGDDKNFSIHLPPDPSLLNTASYVNLFNGKDKETRLPHSFHDTRDIPAGSRLAQKMGQGEFVVTLEIASPRTEKGLKKVRSILERTHHLIDAVNTTTNAGGVPSLHSTETAKTVAEFGVEPIIQFCGRDQSSEVFIQEMEKAMEMGYRNFLLLTGDWLPQHERKNRQQTWFPMDSSQMIHNANGKLQTWKNRFGFAPFIGCAANPFSTPTSISVERLKFKREAGARFCQTQAITHVATFREWYRVVRKGRENKPRLTIPSIPLVGSRKLFEVLCRLPGVYVDPSLHQAMESESFQQACLDWAFDIVEGVSQEGAAGIHAMNFGMPPEMMNEFLTAARERAQSVRTSQNIKFHPANI